MPPVNPNEEPIDIVARPVNPDGTFGRPETEASPGPDSMDVAFPGDAEQGSGREQVRYWRFQGAGDDGCGCGGCGCLTVVVMLLGLMLLRGCTSLLFR